MLSIDVGPQVVGREAHSGVSKIFVLHTKDFFDSIDSDRTFLHRPVSAEWTTQIGSGRTFRGEVRCSDAFRPGHAQVADRCSPVRILLTNAA
jgi:hypothetical protein